MQGTDDRMQEGGIGIIGAMDSEVELLLDALEDACLLDYGAGSCVAGKLEGHRVWVAQCGVGKVFAAACAQALASMGARAIVSTGAAGAVDPKLHVGDFVVGTDCVQHDVDLCNFGYELGQVPKMPVAYPTDGVLADRMVETLLANTGCTVHRGRIVSGDRFVREVSDRQRIAQSFGALCCDMETAAIAQVCFAHGIPFAVVRAISDMADGSQPEAYDEFEQKAAHASAQALRLMLAHLGQTSDCQVQTG